MPAHSAVYFVRFFHGLFSFGVLYALIYFKTDLQDALLFKKDIDYAAAYMTLFAFTLLLYYVTCFMDPGFVQVSSHQQIIYEHQSYGHDFASMQLRTCGFCGIKQPLRARHCEDCHRCVHKFDHHCPWLDTCIGERNHRFFYLFLLTEAVLTYWSLIIACRGLVYKTDPFEWLKVNYLLLSVAAFVACCFVTSLALVIMHTYVMVFNVTTWEFVSRRRITYLRDLRSDFNPFHQGFLVNMWRFLIGSTYNWEHTYVQNTFLVDYYDL